MNPTQERELHWLFRVGVVLKGINALVELVLGILFSFTGTVATLILFFTRNELIEDPGDFVATHIRSILPYLSTHVQLFGAFYLISHGIVKLFLVWGLLKGKLWAYPASLVFLSMFIIYQIVKYVGGHSIFILLLTVFDVIVAVLIWHEYMQVKKSSR